MSVELSGTRSRGKRIWILSVVAAAVICAVFLTTRSKAADLVELLSGAKVRGKVISQDGKYVTVNAVIGKRTLKRKYPLSRVKAITIDGKRTVLSAKSTGGSSTAKATPRRTTRTKSGAGLKSAAGQQRSRTEVLALIRQEGSSPPDWFDSAPLRYPKTLDLSWPMPPPKGWNSQKNVGQYKWDVLNPNPNKWREGVKFFHHLLSQSKGDREVLKRTMNSLGQMYHNLLEDHARAAFWWQQSGADKNYSAPQASMGLAECYWLLGNRQMALDLLKKIPPRFGTIKLLADMGETAAALKMADSAARGGNADLAYLYAGDACRVAERFQQAEAYYRKVIAIPAEGKRKERIQKNQNRARAAISAIKLYDTLDLKRVPDGRYESNSIGYAGQVYVAVTVKAGRITDVKVARHKEKQFYSALTDTPRKILRKQSVKGIDATTSATITSEAIIISTAKALAAAMKR